MRTWPKNLLQRDANLAHVVHFRRKGSERIQLILGCQRESRLVRTSRPGQLHTCFQTIVQALVDATTELVAIVPTRRCSSGQVRMSVVRSHVGQQAEIFGSESDGEVILGQGCFGGAVNILVPSEPALVTDDDGSVQNWACSVEADVGFDVRFVVSESGAKIGGLLSTTKRGGSRLSYDVVPCIGSETGVEHDFESLSELIIGSDFAFQQVVGVPLLQERQAVLGHDVFRFQSAERACRFGVVFADDIEIHAVGRTCLQIEFE